MLKIKHFLGILLIATVTSSMAQSNAPLILTPERAESLFLTHNLELLASLLDVSQSEALLVQSKLWPNPSLEISEVNSWHTQTDESMPFIHSVNLEQLIQTAGKRKKNTALHQLTLKEKQLEFEIILRELKLQLRQTLTDVQLHQEKQTLYANQIEATEQLIHTFQNQLEKGHISQAAYIRLKAASMQFKKELLAIKKEGENSYTTLRNLLALPPSQEILLATPLSIPNNLADPNTSLLHWDSQAAARPELLLMSNLEEQALKQLELEKANRIPDITVALNYDKAGQSYRNYLGLGATFDLPIWDRNKGNIKSARIELEKKQSDTKAKQLQINNEIIAAHKQHQYNWEMMQAIAPGYEEVLDKLLASYQENFKNKNVSLIEYLDFVEAYLENKTLILETKKELSDSYEYLQFTLGTLSNP